MQAPHSDNAPGQGPAVFAAAADLPALEAQLGQIQSAPVALQAGGPDEAAAWCRAHPTPTVLLVDISTCVHPLPALLALAGQAGPACRIVTLGDRHDVDLYRQLLQAGIFDYLVQPVSMDLLADTLARAEGDVSLEQAGNARAGRSVAFAGTHGGLGVSTLTAALGQWLAATRQTPTILVDFDRRKGDLALLLGLEADEGLASLLAAPAIDPRLLQRTLLTVDDAQRGRPSRLHLLAQRPGAETPVDPERVLELGGALCQRFSLSLWDLPSHRPLGADEVLAHADIRVVLTELTVQGARNTHRLLEALGTAGPSQRLLLVASHARHAARPALESRHFEDFVGRPIDLHLPHAGTALAASLEQGPLTLRGSPGYAQAVEQLGLRVLGLPEAGRPSQRGLARLLAWLRLQAPHSPARA